MTKKTVFTILQVVIFTALAVFLIVWQMREMTDTERAEMFASIESVRPWFLVPVVIVGFCSHFFRALRWKLLLEPLDIRPTNANTFFAVMIGYLVNTVLPRFGEVAKCTVLAKYEKVPADKMVGTIVAERAWDLVCLLVIIFISIVFQVSLIGEYALSLWNKLQSGTGHTLLYITIAVTTILVLIILFYQRIKRTKVGRAIKGIGDGVKSIMKMKRRWLFLGYTFVIWGSYLFMILLGMWGMPATDDLGPLAAITILAFGSISIIITPGGIGAYPPIVGAILMLYGIKMVEGNAFGWVAWSAQTAVIILFGIISLILLPLYNRKPHDAQTGMDTTQNN